VQGQLPKCRPASTLAAAMATLSREGLFDSGEAVGLPPAAAAQVAQWMSYLPHAGQWDARLPRPAGR
jgi:hypothetical protein